MELFHKYEPKYKTQEAFEVFVPFKSYSDEDSTNILSMINKSNKNAFYVKSLNDIVQQKNKLSYMSNTKNHQA